MRSRWHGCWCMRVIWRIGSGRGSRSPLNLGGGRWGSRRDLRVGSPRRRGVCGSVSGRAVRARPTPDRDRRGARPRAGGGVPRRARPRAGEPVDHQQQPASGLQAAGQLRLVDASEVAYPAGETVPGHSHPSVQLVSAISGVLRTTSSNGARVLPPSRTLLVPAEPSHAPARPSRPGCRGSSPRPPRLRRRVDAVVPSRPTPRGPGFVRRRPGTVAAPRGQELKWWTTRAAATR